MSTEFIIMKSVGYFNVYMHIYLYAYLWVHVSADLPNEDAILGTPEQLNLTCVYTEELPSSCGDSFESRYGHYCFQLLCCLASYNVYFSLPYLHE